MLSWKFQNKNVSISNAIKNKKIIKDKNILYSVYKELKKNSCLKYIANGAFKIKFIFYYKLTLMQMSVNFRNLRIH